MSEGARKSVLLGTSLLVALACAPSAWGQASTPTPGQNVNMVSGMFWPFGDPFLERQDEPSLGVSTRNPLHLLAGANDYRTVDLNTLLETEPGESNVCPTGVTPCPPSAEPWVGQYISIDGGARWQSTLLPGYPQDKSAQGVASPLHAFTTAADPVIASGTNGMFYYGGIAFNRGSSQGLVFVARYMDLNNKENGDITQDSFPVRYIDTLAVAHGSSVPANFLDKPAIAVDIPRGSSTCTINVPQAGGSVQQRIPAGNVYVAYANVATSSSGNITSTIYFTHSTNCGQTWSTPQAISQRYNLSQGATIQIDPETGIVYVAWRVIHSGIQQPNDGIAIAASLDGGNRFFGPLTLVSLPAFNPLTPRATAFFDQGTTLTSFRTTAYPAMAVADSGIAFVPGPLYLAWSQRGMGPNGEARIMMLAIPGNGMFTSSGFKPPTPFVVDNGAITNDIGGTFPVLTSGFQLMPAMTFNQGKLMLIYYDLRQDHTTGDFTPSVSLTGDFMPDANGNFFEEARDQIAENATCDVPLYFISDACLTKRRKTIDLVLAQSNGGLGVPTFTYSRVSHYDFGLFAGETVNTFHQVKYDPPNLPMFAKGLAAFLGDYLGIAGQPFVLVKCGNSQCWTYNNPSPPGVAGTSFAAPKPAPTSPVHYATWTSNQDVIPPIDNDWTMYIPVTSGTSVYNGSPTQACVVGTNNGHEGDRNQNVYSSRITQGLSITSPQTSKPLSSTVQRGFVILLQNQSSGRPTSSGFVNYFRLSIANQPVNGFASFAQLVPPGLVPKPPFPAINGNGTPFPQASIDVAIAPHTGVARTVFAVSSNPTASILVNVTEMDSLGAGSKVVPGGLSGFILLNADGTVPTSLVDPNVPSGDPNNISNVELYDPNVSAPNVSAPNVSAPNVSAPNVSAPNVSAPNVSAPNVSAYGVVNPNVSAPNVSAPNVSAAPPQSDGTYTVTNNRNTNASYNVAVIGQSSTRLQLLLSQIYMTPQTDGQCGLIAQQQNITLANVPNTPITPPDQLSSLTTPNVSAVPVTSPSFSLGPHDTAYITLRGNVDIATMKQILTKVAPAIIPQGIKSNDTTSTVPSIVAPLFITTATLPNGAVGQPYNPPSGAQLQAIGGTLGTGECSRYFWNWSAASDSAIPPGLTLSQRGVISGTPTAPGIYEVLIQVSTCVEEVATRVLSIRVLAPLAITTTSLPTATQGISNGPVTLLASGGTGSYNWTPATVDGMSLNNSGVLGGTPTTTGTFPFTATVSDSGPPVQTVSQLMTLTVVPATPAPPTGLSTLLFDNFNAAGVVQNPNGPTNPTTFTLPSTSVITQMATYHWNGGAGATPGTIALQLQFPGGFIPIFGPFPTVGVTGQNNVANAAWATSPNPNVIVPAGTYTVVDSGPATWSYNSGSNNAGFTRVWGFAVQVSALSFVTQPTNATASRSISPAVQVKATDSSGAVLPFIAITISIGSNSSGGTLSGTLTQTTDATGVATFSDLSIDKAGSGYTLLASSTPSVRATSTPFSIAAGASSGSRYLIVTDGQSSPSSIFRVVPDGSSTALVATLATGRAIAVSIDPTTNTLYSVDPFNKQVLKVSLWGGAVSSIFTGAPLTNPVAVAVDSAGNVYVGDNSTDAVYKFTPAGAQALFANLPASPTTLQDIRMAFDASGNLVVGSDFVGDVANVSEIDRISPTGVSTTVYNSATMNGGTAIKEIGGLAIDVSGNIIVVDFANGSIVKVANPGTSTMTATTLITNPSLGGSTAITGLTVVDSAAGIYDVTANFANKILSVNTSTNTITTLVSGAPLTYPTDIAITGSIPSPQPATNVTPVVNSSAPSVTLNWTASTSAVTGYNVYRNRNGGGFTKIASVPASATSYTDTGVTFGDSLDYYVTSVDSSNVESVPSNVVHTGLP